VNKTEERPLVLTAISREIIHDFGIYPKKKKKKKKEEEEEEDNEMRIIWKRS
jgi:hypothetical protein